MALIAVAADKGAPGVTTACVALAAVWPRPVLLAECDPAGGDLMYRLPAAGGGQLDPGRGLLSLAVAVRRGLAPVQAFEHAQKLHGGLDLLVGVVTAEQGAGLDVLWGPAGAVLARLPGIDTIADCGRLGAAGPYYDLLAQASVLVLVTRPTLAEVVRLRERIAVLSSALSRHGPTPPIAVVVVAEHRRFHSALADVGQALGADSPATVLGGLAWEPRSADRLRGEWGGRLDRSLLIRTARDLAGQLAARVPVTAAAEPGAPAARSPADAPALAVTPAAQARSAAPAAPPLPVTPAAQARPAAPAAPPLPVTPAVRVRSAAPAAPSPPSRLAAQARPAAPAAPSPSANPAAQNFSAAPATPDGRR